MKKYGIYLYGEIEANSRIEAIDEAHSWDLPNGVRIDLIEKVSLMQ